MDPKAAGSAHYDELLRLLDRQVTHSTNSFIANMSLHRDPVGAGGAATRLPQLGLLLRQRGGVGAGTSLAATQGDWDLLGMDVDASPRVWAEVTALNRPVVAHVVGDAGQAQRGLDAGAHGLMLSGVSEVLRAERRALPGLDRRASGPGAQVPLPPAARPTAAATSAGRGCGSRPGSRAAVSRPPSPSGEPIISAEWVPCRSPGGRRRARCRRARSPAPEDHTTSQDGFDGDERW